MERNYDGWPEVVCTQLPEDTYECQDCRDGRCEDCGALVHLGELHDRRCELQQAVDAAEGEGMVGQ